MAITNRIASEPLAVTPSGARLWNEYAFHGYAMIAARKHGFVPPAIELAVLSNEELANLVSLVRDLAHLPPG